MKRHFRAIALGLSLVSGLWILAVPEALAQGRYSITHTGDVIRLHDTEAKTTLSVLTGLHVAYEMVVNGQDVIRRNFTSLDEVRENAGVRGLPVLWPYANRLDEQAFYANGQKYTFDMGLGNTGRGAIPIHGLVRNDKTWELVEARADATGAWVTARLDFYKNPRYMKQFPFAHTLTVTYILSDGAVEVRTQIHNMSSDPMPVAVGYHPYFTVTDVPPQEWTMSVGAKTHWLLDSNTIPTGQTQSISRLIPTPENFKATDRQLDDVFTDLVRDSQGRAEVTLKGRNQRIAVQLGPKYRAVLVLSRPARGGGAGSAGATASAPTLANAWDVAIEPMAGISNSMNLAQRGLYNELQSVLPGATWEESFWVRPSGF